MSDFITNILTLINSKLIPQPSEKAVKLVLDFLHHQSSSGNKPTESFFNWNNTRGFSAQITYRTYQRTIFKRYHKNKSSLYASLD